MKRNKIITTLIIIATIILAGIAIFTAIRLYQLRKETVAPTAPEKSKAQVVPTPTPGYEACSALSFTISTPAPGVCNSLCVTNSDCSSSSTTSASNNINLICYQPSPTPCPTGPACITVMPPKACRNQSCPTKSDCVCSTATATPTVTPTSTSTSTPTGSASATPTPTSTKTATPTGTSSPISQATATPAAGLPAAGTTLPTLIGIGAGIILLIISIALAI